MFIAQLALLSGAFFYVLPFIIFTILAPLHMFNLGFSVIEIGILVSVPAVFSTFGHVLGGVLCDRFGFRWIMIAGYGLLVLTSIGFIMSNTFTEILITMMLRGLTGIFFWPSSQSYASLINPLHLDVILGRHTSVVASASIIGALAGGYLALHFGIVYTFCVAALVALVALLIGVFTPKIKVECNGLNQRRVFSAEVFRLIKTNRYLYLACICAFFAAIPLALIGSFYSLYFSFIGFDEKIIGILGAFLNSAVLVSGLVFSKLYAHFGAYFTFWLSVSFLGVALILTALSGSFYLIALIMFLTGFTSGLLAVMRLSLVSTNTLPEVRGGAIGIVEMGYGTALLIIPIFFAFVTEIVGYSMTFILLGIFLLFLGFVMKSYFKNAYK